MKRVPNKTAICTICYGITGLQKIKVLDFENEYDLTHDQNGRVAFDGLVKDLLIDWHYCRIADAEYHGMKIDGDTIVMKVFTKYEEYK